MCFCLMELLYRSIKWIPREMVLSSIYAGHGMHFFVFFCKIQKCFPILFHRVATIDPSIMAQKEQDETAVFTGKSR